MFDAIVGELATGSDVAIAGWTNYGQNLEDNLRDLRRRVHSCGELGDRERVKSFAQRGPGD